MSATVIVVRSQLAAYEPAKPLIASLVLPAVAAIKTAAARAPAVRHSFLGFEQSILCARLVHTPKRGLPSCGWRPLCGRSVVPLIVPPIFRSFPSQYYLLADLKRCIAAG